MPDRRSRIDGRRREAPGRRAAVLPFLAADPYLGDGEFYLEYGDFEVSVTVPEGWLVTGTGELVNAAERLPPEALGRLEAALASDTVVRVTSAPELLPRGATERRD